MKKRVVKKEKTEKKSKNKINRWIYWSPRVLTILFILFISIFALDVFGNGYSFLQTIIALFIHLLPSIVLLIFLIFAWKFEWIGAMGFFIFSIWFSLVMKGEVIAYFIIGIPAIAIGILWWLSWSKKIKL